MTTGARIPRLPLVPETAMDAECRALMETAREKGTPTENYFRILANHPEIMKSYAGLWQAVFWGGEVPNDIKEAVRLFVANTHACEN